MTKLFKAVLFSLLLLAHCLSAYQYEVAIMTIFRDEGDWLKEWIDYHKKIGVEHFYLYNHLSGDDYKEVLQPYIADGTVELIEWTHEKFPEAHVLAIKHAISRLKTDVKWLAIVDTDEFIVPKKVNNIKDFLAKFEDQAGVMINWQLFGTSNIQSLSRNESLLKNLTWKFPTKYTSNWSSNRYCKSIIRPDRIDEFTTNPQCGNHVFWPIKGSMVNSKGQVQEIQCMMKSVYVNDIQINHYWFRTLDWFYKHKMDRRINVGEKFPQDLLDKLFKEGHSEQDFSIQRLIN